ncbi:MAG: hypothetical protein FWH48_08500, partial [Oscillospiraceae bacterium]|nr:hypothetical protein [Oscillospiraceae bacterium]
GDQMPVHVPLSAEAQAEARFLMLSANNLLKPVDGHAVTVPSQDLVLGAYYLTMLREDEPGKDKVFRDFDEAIMAYENGYIGLHVPIKIHRSVEIDGKTYSKLAEGSVGRFIFNRILPQDLGYVDRTDESNLPDLEINFETTSKELKDIIDRCIKRHGTSQTASVLDQVKNLGFKYSTQGAITIAVSDMTIPPEKYTLVKAAEEKVEEINNFFSMGELTEEERYKNVTDTWDTTTKAVTAALQAYLHRHNPIYIMQHSGARGTVNQMRQLAGMRGLMFSATGQTMEMPIKSNFREGLNILEYFIASRGSRKTLADTALRTADSGYLTRRLVDVSQEVIIHSHDCHTKQGIWVSEIRERNEVLEPFKDRLLGRYTIGQIINPTTGELIADDDTMLTDEHIKEIIAANIEKVHIRSVLRCRARSGVCIHCYGSDLATGKPVNIGESVGIIAAQSIGEPGTQLTMRTFQAGGIASSNITQGLPRVEELFEARRPKKCAILSEIDGYATIAEIKRNRHITIKSPDVEDERIYSSPMGIKVLIENGEYVEKGTPLTEGDLAPADITKIIGLDAVYDYITKEIQRVYRGQSVEINDKHIEVIARQMTRKVRVEDAGDTLLLYGSLVDSFEFEDENHRIQKLIDMGEELRLASCSPVLLGITKASLSTESFLSAASFQETTKVLTEAAIKGKVDELLGLKENVIIGKLIPAGTGLQSYRDIGVAEAGSIEAIEFEQRRLDRAAREDIELPQMRRGTKVLGTTVVYDDSLEGDEDFADEDGFSEGDTLSDRNDELEYAADRFLAGGGIEKDDAAQIGDNRYASYGSDDE